MSDGIITDLKNDPYLNQFIIGIFGRPGCGKTTLATDLARAGQFVYLISADRGTSRIRLNPEPYQGHLALIYMDPTKAEAEALEAAKRKPSYIEILYKRLSTVVQVKIPELIGKGIKPERIWIIIDTLTHMQKSLLREGQDAMVNFNSQPKGNNDNRKEMYSRIQNELTTPPEWNANLAVMSRVTDYLMTSGVNIVYLFQEKADKEFKEVYRAVPEIQAASYNKVLGDLDVLLYCNIDITGKHRLFSRPSSMYEAKDRYDKLDPEVPFTRAQDGLIPALLAVKKRIFTKPEAPATASVKE